MKQTAVEWLLKKISSEYRLVPNDDIIEQAKEIEKQQIIDAVGAPIIGEQYYNETFKSE